MAHRYIIYPEKGLILQYFSNKVGLEDLVAYLDSITADPFYNPKFDRLTLLVDADLSISVSGIKHYAARYSRVVNHSDMGRHVILVDQPSQTALAQIFKNEIVNRQNLQIFSTCESACHWLNLDIAVVFDEIESFKKQESAVRQPRL